MTRHIFFACDICNSLGVRIPDQRRGANRDFRSGRRNTDGRAWFEGTEEQARECGWEIRTDGRDVCPDCLRRGLDENP